MTTENDRKLLKYRLSQRNDIVIKDSDRSKSSIGLNIKHNSVAPSHIFDNKHGNNLQD